MTILLTPIFHAQAAPDYHTIEQSGNWQLDVNDADHSAKMVSQQDGFQFVIQTNPAGNGLLFGVAIFRRNPKMLVLHIGDKVLYFDDPSPDPNSLGAFTDFDGAISNDMLVPVIHALTIAKTAYFDVDGEQIPISLSGTSSAVNALDQYSQKNNMHLPLPFHDDNIAIENKPIPSGKLTKIYGSWRLLTDEKQQNQIMRYIDRALWIDIFTPADDSGVTVTIHAHGVYSQAELTFGGEGEGFTLSSPTYDSRSNTTTFTQEFLNPLNAPLIMGLTDNQIATVLLVQNKSAIPHIISLNCISCIVKDVGTSQLQHTPVAGLYPYKD